MLGWHVPCDDPRGAACNGARGTSNHLGRQTMEFKRSVLGAVVIGAAAFSGSALAAATGNVGGFSEYMRSEEHTSELQSLMRNSYAVFCLKKKKKHSTTTKYIHIRTQTYKSI